eukprot:9826708-Alexandrium_andersonii.AAC.1
MGQDLRWLVVTQGVLTPEDAARAVQRAIGVPVAGQAAQAMNPEVGDFVDMVLLQGPPESRSPMERRLTRNPV